MFSYDKPWSNSHHSYSQSIAWDLVHGHHIELHRRLGNVVSLCQKEENWVWWSTSNLPQWPFFSLNYMLREGRGKNSLFLHFILNASTQWELTKYLLNKWNCVCPVFKRHFFCPSWCWLHIFFLKWHHLKQHLTCLTDSWSWGIVCLWCSLVGCVAKWCLLIISYVTCNWC